MDVLRETVIRVILSGSEVVMALKKAYPHDLNIQALPLNASARGVHLTATIHGAMGLSIVYKKDTTVPAPAPIITPHDPGDYDPA